MYYYRDSIHYVGPFEEKKLIELHSKGIINGQSLIRSAESDAWFEYSKLSRSTSNPNMPLDRMEPIFTVNPLAESYSQPTFHAESTETITQVDSTWVLSPAAPWRRYFARVFDLTVFGVIAWFLIGYAWYSIAPLQADNFFNQLNPTFDAILTIFLGSLVSGLVLGFVGTTPGKSIFGVRVKTLKGQSIGLSNGIARDFTIFIKGLGLGLPLISLITLILSYQQLKKRNVMSWDAGQYAVTYRRNTGAQIAITIAGVVLYLVIIVLLLAASRMS